MRALLLALMLGGLPTAPIAAHGGGLNAEGCHSDRKNGGYHCHRSPSSRSTLRPSRLLGGGPVYYANCAAARAAGAAPVHEGEPGYARHLDRDGDGTGCE